MGRADKLSREYTRAMKGRLEMQKPWRAWLITMLVLTGVFVSCGSEEATTTTSTAPSTTTAPAATDLVSKGRDIYSTTGLCTTCHANANIPATGTLGPDHTHIATEAMGRLGGMSLEEYLRQSIVDPSAALTPEWEGSEGLMEATITPLNLTSQDVDALVAFLLTQK